MNSYDVGMRKRSTVSDEVLDYGHAGHKGERRGFLPEKAATPTSGRDERRGDRERAAWDTYLVGRVVRGLGGKRYSIGGKRRGESSDSNGPRRSWGTTSREGEYNWSS